MSENDWEKVRKEQDQYYSRMAVGYIEWSRDRIEKRLSPEMRNYWLEDCFHVERCQKKIIRKQQKIAEVGSGPSRLDDLHLSHVICIDISLPMLLQARLRLPSQARFLNANSQAIPLTNGAVDLVVCSNLLSHMPDNLCLKSVSEMFRILRAGGKLMLIDSHFQSTSPSHTEGDIQWRQIDDGKELQVYKKYRSPDWFMENIQASIVEFYSGHFLFCIVWQKVTD
jgi:ubiquinone/menaquinone biosynthesis C-methylase UbiE